MNFEALWIIYFFVGILYVLLWVMLRTWHHTLCWSDIACGAVFLFGWPALALISLVAEMLKPAKEINKNEIQSGNSPHYDDWR